MQIAAKFDDSSGTELSFAEEIMWQADLGGPGALPFFDCGRSLWLVLRLQGPLNKEALRTSLEAVVQRHAVLRSRFVARNGQPVRLMSQPPSFSFATIEKHDLSSDDPCEILENEINPRLEGKFDLALSPLVQAVLMALGSRQYMLAIAVHHIVCDRWSMRLLQLELKRFYSTCITGMEIGVQPLRLQYQDYVIWQREQLNSERVRTLSQYWINKLAGLPDLVLPAGTQNRAISTRAASSWFTIPADEVNQLTVLSRQSRTTLAATMLAIFTIFLYRLSGMDDVAVGVPLSDRRRPEFEELIGLFMNVVVVRTSILKGTTFLELLDRVRRNLVDACLRQDLPYGYLQRIVSTRPLYRVVFNFMPVLPGTDLEWTGLRAESIPVAMELQSLADLSLHLRHEGGALVCRLMYKTDLFSSDSAQNFASQIQALVTAVLQAPQYCIETYPGHDCR